ncbi:succinate-semialdehyde dehydrogenase (NADP+) [Fusarium oxysporum f. sp. pisi HDV247]|uniref:Succinate-semialdehyde dehydrogenase (NADP+) n=1 Tax=Fusarium oxysporum f. sp. pisi HDV247 TaxID=1080344 RepID=W9N7P0_FUSOX|nr:succinate-semialdehyde dehydrogenase (NADP+) [Fusarium oxysporum f. sp. pisi HDV247]
MRLFHEEIFGPVAALIRFNNEDEAVDAANDCDVGLASYVYTKDIGRAARVTETLQAGMVALNTGVVSDAAAPFGGVKQSGLGREGSKYGIDDYMSLKTVITGNVNVQHRSHI